MSAPTERLKAVRASIRAKCASQGRQQAAGAREDTASLLDQQSEAPMEALLSSAVTPEWNKKFEFRVRSGKIRRSPHGSNNALPEMRKTNGPGCHLLRPHRPPMH